MQLPNFGPGREGNHNTTVIPPQTKVGESVKAVGNVAELGDWDINKGAKLKWSEGHVWSITTTIPVGKEVNFKVIKGEGCLCSLVGVG